MFLSMCGPQISLDAFPLESETCFLFYLFGENWFLEKTCSRHLF